MRFRSLHTGWTLCQGCDDQHMLNLIMYVSLVNRRLNAYPPHQAGLPFHTVIPLSMRKVAGFDEPMHVHQLLHTSDRTLQDELCRVSAWSFSMCHATVLLDYKSRALLYTFASTSSSSEDVSGRARHKTQIPLTQTEMNHETIDGKEIANVHQHFKHVDRFSLLAENKLKCLGTHGVQNTFLSCSALVAGFLTGSGTAGVASK